jgi:hypothetical protein
MHSAAEMQLRHILEDFVCLYERLCPEDDPSIKPNYSYSELVFLAILRSPNFCLPIGEIYKYIQSRFAFFRTSKRQHWKNAVRHSLSKTKCFSKISVGRGVAVTKKLHKATYLWCLVPTSITSFARGDYRPTIDKDRGTNTLQYGYHSANASHFWGQVAVYLERKMAAFKRALSGSYRPGEIFEEQICKIPQREEIFQRGNFFDRQKMKSDPSPPSQCTASSENNTYVIKEGKETPAKTEATQLAATIVTDKANAKVVKDDSGIVSDTFVSNSSVDISLTDSNVIEHSLNLLSRHTSSPVPCDVIYIGDDNIPDDRKTPELPDLRNVSPFGLSPILSNTQDMSQESSKMPVYSAYPPQQSYRVLPPYNASMMSQPYPIHHSSPFPHHPYSDESGFPAFGLFYPGYPHDSGGTQDLLF